MTGQIILPNGLCTSPEPVRLYFSLIRRSLQPRSNIQDVLFGSSDIPMHLLVDDQLLTSFEQLVQLSAQDQYKDREFIEVREMPVMPTGG